MKKQLYEQIFDVGNSGEYCPICPVYNFLKNCFGFQSLWDCEQKFEVIKVHIIPQACK